MLSFSDSQVISRLKSPRVICYTDLDGFKAWKIKKHQTAYTWRTFVRNTIIVFYTLNMMSFLNASTNSYYVYKNIKYLKSLDSHTTGIA